MDVNPRFEKWLKVKEPVIVWVRWLDASCDTEWTAGDVDPEFVLDTVGIEMNQSDQDFLVIAGDYSHQTKEYRNVSVIPRVNILSIRTVQRFDDEAKKERTA